MASRSEPKKEDLLEVALGALVVLAAMGLLVWVSASARIVQFWTPVFLELAKAWPGLPRDLGMDVFGWSVVQGRAFLADPKSVTIGRWLLFTQWAAWPAAIAGVSMVVAVATFVLVKPAPRIFRRLDADALARNMSRVFTGIAPVLHIREDLAKDRDPLWRRQLFPHEALLNGQVDGKPLVVDGVADRDRCRDYFRGIVTKVTTAGTVQADLVDGRLKSSMLGLQVVDLLRDRGKGVVFADRFSNQGKVIFALLASYAYGGDEGATDCAKAIDQLNNSARGAPHGFANLPVAQWLYAKYRTHPRAQAAFAVHHWEYTYLYDLFVQAKRQGKITHAQFLWLKPMSRTLFYVLNTVGRMTPHTESAAAFAQFLFERRAAKMGRLPLMRSEDGSLRPSIFVDNAVEGLLLEWDRWVEGEEEEGEWWRDGNAWTRLNNIRIEAPTLPPPDAISDTPFDRMMTEEGSRITARQAAAEADAVHAAAAAASK